MADQILDNNNIRLRAVEPEDSVVLYGCENDTSEWWAGDTVSPYSVYQLRQYALTTSNDPFSEGQLRLIAMDSISKEIIGIVDLYDISPVHLRAFVGIFILPQYRNKGYGLQCLNILSNYCQKILGLHNLAAKILIFNKNAIQLFTKAGYKKSAHLESWQKVGTSFHDLIIMTRNLINLS